MPETDDIVIENNQNDDIQNLSNKDASSSDSENYCIRLMHEFLLSYEFELAAASFIKECPQLGFAQPDPPIIRKDRIKRENVHLILKHFTTKDHLKFFDAWKSLVPVSIQQKLEYKKITFYLHVHFAVLHLRNQQESVAINIDPEVNDTDDKGEDEAEEKDCSISNEEEGSGVIESPRNQGMEGLRQFLETQGTEFSAEPEFLPYYALPFVSDPASHPSFKDLFMEEWVAWLSGSVCRFLEEHSWGATVAPQLLLMCSMNDAVSKPHSQLADMHKNYKQLRRRYHKLHKDHHSLISVAAELTAALENSVKGQAVDLKATLSNCSKIFPELFNSSLYTDLFPDTLPEGESRRLNVQTQEDIGASSSSFELDFKKIKHHLATGSVKTRLLLFQALRWRITRSNLDARDNTVSAFLRHDILSLYRGSGCGSLALAAHFAPEHATTPHPLQQVAARLVNALASLRCGRDYLCSADRSLLFVLLPCLTGERGLKTDTVTANMILATLQKLSLRHGQRVAMLESGLVEWLVRHLSENATSMKAYTLEYSTALMMNLCLHRRAKERCVPLAKEVLKVLTDLLGTELSQAVPYVNGTLYSLLANSQINHEAKRMGLANILEYYLKHSTGEMHKQLEYILKLHRGDCQPDHSATSEEESTDDDTEEVDLLEEELDADDPVRAIHGELSGEELLYQQYRLLFPYHSVVHPSSSTQPGELFVRPTTPRRHSVDSDRPGSNIGQPMLRSGKDSLVSLASTLEQVQEITEIEVHVHTLGELEDHCDDSIVLESLESEMEKEGEEIVCHTLRSLIDGQYTARTMDTIGTALEGSIEQLLPDAIPQTQPPSATEDG